MSIPESGVGIIYFSGFEQILESNPDLIQVIEIEPQTFWYRSNSGLDSFTFDKEKVDYLKSSQKTKLFHGVGYPIGGILQPNINHLGCLKQMELELNPVGMSEHLSFNNIKIDNHILNTNFLLPPLQSPEGLEIAVNSILKYKNYFNIPFSFETGVNYLAPKNYEIEDGLFINTVAENSNCDILLDIHNIIANERNGRQKVRNFFKQISHERVTQIHLAGGFYYKGYYLDAHSNISSDEIIKVFENIVCQLPNLKAIIFEMLPEYLSFIPQNAISIQLEKMNRIWERRGIYHKRNKIVSNKKINSPPPTVAEWELTLGTLAIGRDLTCDTELSRELKIDKGLIIIKELVEKFKGSLIVSSLKLSCRYFALKYGMNEFNDVLRVYWKNSISKLFASDNGLDFAKYLMSSSEFKDDEDLETIIKYEIASINSIVSESAIEVQLIYHPEEMVNCLANLELFDNLKKNNYLVTIEPDFKKIDGINTVFHS